MMGNGNQNADVLMAEVASLLQAGKKLEAIKVYRRITGASLIEAREALERIEMAIIAGTFATTGAVAAEANSLTSTGLGGAANIGIHEEALIEIERMLLQRKKIDAIKLYRKHTGAGLSDAKSAIDRIEQLMLLQGF